MLRKLILFSAVCILTCLSLVLTVTPSKAHHPCDRACLEVFVDRYVDALVARDASTLPVSKHVRFTENTAELKLGQGFWGTVTGKGTFKIYTADTQTGQIGYFGTMYEHGVIGAPDNLVTVTLRLKVENRLITEIETFVNRNAPFLNPPNLVTARPAFSEILQPSERSSRKSLSTIPYLYALSIVKTDGSLAPFADDCARVENGTQTVLNPELSYMLGYITPLGLNGMGLTCAQQMSFGGFTGSEVDGKALVVDEEKGLVFAMLMFGGEGKVLSFTTHPLSGVAANFGGVDEYPGGEILPTTNGPQPGVGPIVEVFRVKNGKIHEVEAFFGVGLPYGASDGWRNPHYGPR